MILPCDQREAWVDVGYGPHFVQVAASRHKFYSKWVILGAWGWMEHYFWWVGLGGAVWGIILGGWGLVGVGGALFLVGGGG